MYMLFDRFIFVLYILFCYNWFLLGSQYELTLKYVPIISLLGTLSCICVITLLQLQTVVRQDAIKQHEKWETIVWSGIHMLLCILIIADGLEAANIVVIGLIIGILLTGIIIVVGMCACYVIMENGREWSGHVHLTCISFWIMVQFMSIRLPSPGFDYVTTAPVVLMALLRMLELCEGNDDVFRILREAFVWVICIVLHVLCTAKLPFFWGTVVTVTFLIVFNRYFYAALFMAVLPLVSIVVLLYLVFKMPTGSSFERTLRSMTQMYDEWTAEPDILPLDVDFAEDDFDEQL